MSGFLTNLFGSSHSKSDTSQEEESPSTSTKTPARALPPVPQRATSRPLPKPTLEAPSETEAFQTELLESLLTSYFDIARGNIADRTPKAIMHGLVNRSKDELQAYLVEQLYKEDSVDSLLAESSNVAALRQKHETTVRVCDAAQRVLGELLETKLKETE